MVIIFARYLLTFFGLLAFGHHNNLGHNAFGLAS